METSQDQQRDQDKHDHPDDQRDTALELSGSKPANVLHHSLRPAGLFMRMVSVYACRLKPSLNGLSVREPRAYVLVSVYPGVTSVERESRYSFTVMTFSQFVI